MDDIENNNHEVSLANDTFLNKVSVTIGQPSPEDVIAGKETSLRSFRSVFTEIGKYDQVRYLFLVDCMKETDIADIIYYCLICDKAKQKCTLCVKCQQKQRANINDMLSDLLHEKSIQKIYTYTDGKCQEMDPDKARVVRHFSPIFMIDEKKESVAYWRQSVHTFLLDLYRKRYVGTRKDEYLTNYFLPHISPSNLREKLPADRWNDGNVNGRKKYDREKRIVDILVECFCTGKNKKVPISYSQKRYELWKTMHFFEMVKDMPLLAMYIFCILDYFQTDINADSWEKIEQEIFDARDMADGLLQILENIYHSEYHKGYFCFRVHNDSEDRSGKYLRKKYKIYMENWSRQSEIPHNFLEIKVVDSSQNTIPKQFYKDFLKRMEQADEEDKIIYQELLPQASEIRVSSFYENSDFWQRYNEISENVVHHYGLQIFESLVSCYDGYFHVRSQKTDKICLEKEFYSTHPHSDVLEDCAIPGTQYDVLIPFRERDRMQNAPLNVNVNYTEGLLQKYKPCEGTDFTAEACKDVFKRIKRENPDLFYQERKEKTIRELADCLQVEIGETEPEGRILHFTAEKIALTMVELFCKALMLIIAKRPAKQCFYVMITECTQSHFLEITRMMALFYNKQGRNAQMRNTQIFMSGRKEGEEFLITGANLGEAIGSTEKLAFARCIHPDCLKILRHMLKNHQLGVSPNRAVEIVPFDMIEYNSGQETLFESSLRSVLCQDVQSKQFGCRLEKLHVRIGSKIHIRTFYEAELLFHNNYYTSRFAYWLFNELCKNPELDLMSPFVLVGYEDYSEMLLNELCNMFARIGIQTEYLICEDRIVGKFRGKSPLHVYRDSQFIIIIPINSTLTTHIKTSGFLEKAIRVSLENEKEDADAYKIGNVLNYGIILISPEGREDNEYWEKSSAEGHTIISKINNAKMKYYIEVFSEWTHPLTCEACFPKEDYTKEVPLVETNKESVIPMHAINIRTGSFEEADMPEPEQEARKFEELSKFLVYRHVERNGNHFNYYFATEKLWDYPEIRKNVQDWLRKESGKFPTMQPCKVYDIIVAPLHYSNTVFVEEVNGCLFRNAALVLHFDADSEFRMNVRTKYSSLQQLYDNLCMDEEKSIINFHYVDDTIISGRTFHRMKSLISSLIHKKENANVQIHVFQSVVLLINRMSPSSIKEYMPNVNYFLAYFNLKISSMLVNSDACVLCKKYGEWNRLAEQASFNTVYDFWKSKSDRIKCMPVEQIDARKKIDVCKQKRALQYMTASHKAKELLDAACDTGDVVRIRQVIIEKLFPDESPLDVDALIAMLKVLGRPFLTFRKEEKEAVFELMLTMLDSLLSAERPKEEGKLGDILSSICDDAESKVLIVQILMNRLAELESNYIIRKRSIDQILKFSEENIGDEDQRQQFIDNYENRVKQLVGQSKDFAKSLYLEYLLLYDEEYPGSFENKAMQSLCGRDRTAVFKKNVYLENTKLIDYGIEYLAESFSGGDELTEENLRKALNENYYFDNFIKYLLFHKVVYVDDKDNVTEFVSEKEIQKLKGMVRFELLYQRIFQKKSILGYEIKEGQIEEQDLKDKFSEMLECLQDAGGASDGEIIVPYEVLKGSRNYIALGLRKGTELRILENSEQDIWEFMNQNDVFEKDTYAICERKDIQQKWILLKFCDRDKSENSMDVIYLLFPFATQSEGEILHALKNILIFRHKIWEILNLSSSTLLRNWTDDLFYKQQMMKSRAVGHSEFDILLEQFQELSEQISQNDMEGKSNSDKLFYGKYFELLVNSMIGFMNAQVLGNRGTDYVLLKERGFLDFWEGEQSVIAAVSKIWDLEICLEDEKAWKGYKIRCSTKEAEQKNMRPSYDVLRVLFLSVFQNIWRHGMMDKEQKRKVSIKLDQNCLCISNYVDEENKRKMEKGISSATYRSGNGISQAVIFDICQSWYKDIRYEEMFDISETDESRENNGSKWIYVVKLPIVERWEEV